MIELPVALNIPPKLLPLVLKFKDYKYHLVEGGRGSAKTQSVARLILYLCEQKFLRVVCGREVQASIEESVYTVLVDIIRENSLPFTIQAYKIIHNITGSEIRFKGFREQGSVNIKGLEGVDILWIDEAQSITKKTLDILIPTIRKDGCRLIFTMNRFVREDPVFTAIAGRADCQHITINFVDNPFCPLTLKIEAEEVRRRSEKEYNHIWLGQPLTQADDCLFNTDTLLRAQRPCLEPEIDFRQKVVSIDFAAGGGDLCVASVLDRITLRHWRLSEQIAWDNPDTMVSIGKIVMILAEQRPDVCTIDVGGMGYVVCDRLNEMGHNIIRFDGATTEGVDTRHYANCRAEGYYIAEQFFSQENIFLPSTAKTLIRELEIIRRFYKSNGQRGIVSKDKMRAEGLKSPDHADSLMMGCWAINKHLTNKINLHTGAAYVARKTGSRAKIHRS